MKAKDAMADKGEALIDAARDGKVDEARRLLDEGANIEYPDWVRRPPCTVAPRACVWSRRARARAAVASAAPPPPRPPPPRTLASRVAPLGAAATPSALAGARADASAWRRVWCARSRRSLAL